MNGVKVRHVDYSPDEFLAGTVMLTDAECGLYWRACTLIYSTGGPVQIDHLRAVSKSHGNAFNRNLAHLISLGKLTRNGEEIDQKRAENELERARKRFEKASENGTKGNEIRWHSDRNPIDEPIAITNHQPPTTNHIDIPDGISPPLNPPNAKSRVVKKSRLPADWQPSVDCGEYGAGLGLSPERIAVEAEHFRQRCRRDEPVYANHDAAFKTWLNNAAKFQSRGNGNGRLQFDQPTASTLRYREGTEALICTVEQRERFRGSGDRS